MSGPSEQLNLKVHILFPPSLALLQGHKWLFLNFSASPDSSLFQTLLSRKVEVQVERGTRLTPAGSAGSSLPLGPGRCMELTCVGIGKALQSFPSGFLDWVL